MTTPTPPEPWIAPRPRPGPVTTPRLVLRPFEYDDAPALFDAIESSRPDLFPWLPWATTDNRSLAECTYSIVNFERLSAQPNATGFVIGVFDRTTGVVIGGTGLHRIIPETHQAEVGYWMRTDRRGDGLCTEATAHLLSSTFTTQEAGGWGLRRVEILAAGTNAPSAGVPRRLGLREECRRRADRWIDTRGYDDTIAWGVLADEWDCARHRLRDPAPGSA